MGHLLISHKYQNIPKDITDFIYSKAKMYIDHATDITGIGCIFYILKPGLANEWTYIYGDIKIHIVYNTDTFNPKTMVYLK